MRICLFEAYITHSIHRKSKFTIRTTRSTFTANQNLLYAQYVQHSPQIKIYYTHNTLNIHRKSKFTIRTTRSTFTANQTYDDNATYNIQR